MEKCNICGSELKLDLYTRTYFCPNCKGKNTELKNNTDFIFIYNKINDLNRETYEYPIINSLKEKLSEYKIEDNTNALGKIMVLFASKSSYLFSFRKYWSSFNQQIILVVKDLKEFDLPLELRNKRLYSIDDPNLSELLINEIVQFKKFKENHIEEVTKNKDDYKEALFEHEIKSKINSGISNDCINHDFKEIEENKSLKKSLNKYEELFLNKNYSTIIKELTEDIKNNPNDPMLYIYRLMANLKIDSLEGIKSYVKKPIMNFKDFQTAVDLADDELKQKLKKIVDTQIKEFKYQRALITINEMTTKNEVELSIRLLKQINPYKDSEEKIKYYEQELNKFIFDGKINYNEAINKKNSKSLIVSIFIIVFMFIFIVAIADSPLALFLLFPFIVAFGFVIIFLKLKK